MISQSKMDVARCKLGLELAESVADDCAKLYQSEEHKSELTFINELTESGIEEVNETLDYVKLQLKSRLRSLKQLDEAQISYEKKKQNALHY